VNLEALLSTYGYAALVVGTFLEGETILVLAGFAAHRGYMELPWVIAAGFLGTFAGDQFYFYLGRHKGQEFIDRRPRWRARAARTFALLENHPTLLILGFRFLYGLRTITPFIAGASRIPRSRYLLLNILGASVWSVTFGVLGYLFGHSLESMLGNLRRYEFLVFTALAGTGMIVWLIHAARGRRP